MNESKRGYHPSNTAPANPEISKEALAIWEECMKFRQKRRKEREEQYASDPEKRAWDEPVPELYDFFTYKNPRIKEYTDLIFRGMNLERDFGYMDDSYADAWKGVGESRKRKEAYDYTPLSPEQQKKIEEYLHKKLSGHVLIDPGCGGPWRMSRLAENFGASMYVGINIESSSNFRSVVTEGDAHKLEGKESSYYIEDDMLLRLAFTPSGCANILLNGIDSCILRKKEYMEAVADEIARACRPGGVVCGSSVGQTPFDYLKRKYADHFKEVFPYGEKGKNATIRFFEKNSD